ncbi:MAG: aspartate aminotransferase family protein [Alphaproteobacteria bacterium]|nr:aspartate aminotransferase family protein [Alphaproteobacteria bacterium]
MTDRGNSAASRDIAYHVHGYTNLKKHEERGPMIITGGSGIHVTDDAGKSYIEGLAGLWCTALGFQEERLINAATEAMRKLPYYHGFAHKTPDVTIDLAEKLIEIAPVPMSKVLFANSGSEAIDLAVKLIWYFNNAQGRPGKKKIISRLRGYHGVTVAAGSLTGLPQVHGDFDLPIAGILHTDCPHYYRGANDGETQEDFAARCAENLESMIVAEGPDTVAAFFAEPVMGAGGVIVPPPTYFEKVQAVLKKYDVLLLADEVICGFGRTGNMWGSTTFDLKPDMITCAKALSSAYVPISALFVSEPVYQGLVRQSEKLGIFGHGSTYAGHPVAAAVALETLKIYEERNIVEHVRSLSPRLQEGLRKLGDHPLVGEARGVGLVGALELVRNKETKDAFDPKLGVGAHFQGQAENQGLIIRAIGDSIAVCPPLIIVDSEIDELLGCLERALDGTLGWVRESGLSA